MKIRAIQRPDFPLFIVVVLLFTILNMVVNNINHKFYVSDFSVYYNAAADLLHNGRVYFKGYGECAGMYKYSPLTLLWFVPYSLLTFRIAAVLHILLLGIACCYTFMLTRRLLKEQFFSTVIRGEIWLLLISFVCLMIFFVKEIYLGNLNLFLIMLSQMSLEKLLQKKYVSAGIILAIVILTKPFFGLLLLPLVMRKNLKALLIVLAAVTAGLILPGVFLGFQITLQLTSDWFSTMLTHNESYPSVNTVDYLIRHHIFHYLPVYADLIIVIVFVIFYLILKSVRSFKNPGKEKSDQQSFVMEWFIILALLPNLFKTDTEHFLASIPIITFIIYDIRVKRRYFLIPLMIILIFFFGGNSQDLLGKQFSYELFQMGLIGLSNLVMVVMAGMIWMLDPGC